MQPSNISVQVKLQVTMCLKKTKGSDREHQVLKFENLRLNPRFTDFYYTLDCVTYLLQQVL